jgi:hypothetical protein
MTVLSVLWLLMPASPQDQHAREPVHVPRAVHVVPSRKNACNESVGIANVRVSPREDYGMIEVLVTVSNRL